MTAWTLSLPDPAATRQLGRLLGGAARRGDALLLFGPLGAGKTSLSQGLAEGLGITGPVTSPTFTLLNEYRGRLPFFHFDLYRLEPPDVVRLGFADYWEDPRGVVAIEWPERLPAGFAPEGHLACTLAHEPDGSRLASWAAHGPEAERWLSEVASLAARP